ncbi:MAG: DUF4383 domain-containing protein [Solirubrobacterales bacterium]|nr:DUF4383 domain-containing protein [Solirubrobacterales bacterium]
MERIAYARLFSTVVGLLLVVLGLAELLASAEFRNPEITSDLLGLYPANGWAASLHLVIGMIGLALARPLPRLFTLLAGVIFLGLGIWGVLAPNGDLLLGVLPATRTVNLLNLLIGGLGLLAFAASRWDRIRNAAGGWLERSRRRNERRRQRRGRRRATRRRRTTGQNTRQPGTTRDRTPKPGGRTG